VKTQRPGFVLFGYKTGLLSVCSFGSSLDILYIHIVKINNFFGAFLLRISGKNG